MTNSKDIFDDIPKTTTTPLAALLKVIEVIQSTQADSRAPFSRALSMIRGNAAAVLRDESKFAAVNSDCERALLEFCRGPLSNLMATWHEGSPVAAMLATIETESIAPQKPILSEAFRLNFKPC